MVLDCEDIYGEVYGTPKGDQRNIARSKWELPKVDHAVTGLDSITRNTEPLKNGFEEKMGELDRFSH